MLRTTLLVSICALTCQAATVSSFSVFTFAEGGYPCSFSSAGPGSATCQSIGDVYPTEATASATVTDNSLGFALESVHDSAAIASASIAIDTLYSVPVNGPVEAIIGVACYYSAPWSTRGHFSSATATGSLQTICGFGSNFPTNMIIPLVATNNIVELQAEIDGNGGVSDNRASLFVSMSVVGFEANGVPIAATPIPEPSTFLVVVTAIAGLPRRAIGRYR